MGRSKKPNGTRFRLIPLKARISWWRSTREAMGTSPRATWPGSLTVDCLTFLRRSFTTGRIYLIKTGGMLSSVDAKTGQPYYTQERLDAPGDYYSSPVAGGGRIYVASLAGKLTVVKAGGEKPEILRKPGGVRRAHSGLARAASPGTSSHLRTQSTLYAFGSPARSLTRNDAVAFGERGRLDRRFRRPAENPCGAQCSTNR